MVRCISPLGINKVYLRYLFCSAEVRLAVPAYRQTGCCCHGSSGASHAGPFYSSDGCGSAPAFANISTPDTYIHSPPASVWQFLEAFEAISESAVWVMEEVRQPCSLLVAVAPETKSDAAAVKRMQLSSTDSSLYQKSTQQKTAPFCLECLRFYPVSENVFLKTKRPFKREREKRKRLVKVWPFLSAC